MSTASSHDQLELDQIAANTAKLQAETLNLNAETAKMLAEQAKMLAETRFPPVIVAAFLVAILGPSAATIIALIFR